MPNQSWGIELWDQFENISKYTDKSIQFCEKYESFVKDRCTIEDDYAKALKKLTKIYTPKFKEQEEFYHKFSYTIGFCSNLKELQDLASQHELIAENLRERTIKQIQLTIKECREQRKKSLDDYNKIKRQLDKQQDHLIKSLRKYEECYDSARRAKESYEKAHEDLDLSRAQLEKSRDTMTIKTKICDEAHSNYSSQVALYNDTQRIFYERQLPTILNDLQQLDMKRSEELKTVLFHSIQSHAEVVPRIQTCLDEMFKQIEQFNAVSDSQIVINEFKTGYVIPDDQRVIDLNSGEFSSILSNPTDQIYSDCSRSNTLKSLTNEPNGIATIYAPNSSQTLMSNSRKTGGGATSTIRKIFGSSNTKKSMSMNIATINTPYSNLPPAQRLRKFQEQILNCKNELEKKQKAREGLIKMKHVFQENPKFGDEQDVTQQIIAIDENIDKIHAEIRRFESYISEIERIRTVPNTDVDGSIRSRNIYDSDQSIHHRSPTDLGERSSEFHRLPSIDTTNHDSNNSFEDDDTEFDGQYSKAYVLYDFNAHGMNSSQYVNAVSISTGEYVDILEDDHGDGWTRIKKFDGSSGFVPSSYLRVDQDNLSASLPAIESGRF